MQLLMGHGMTIELQHVCFISAFSPFTKYLHSFDSMNVPPTLSSHPTRIVTSLAELQLIVVGTPDRVWGLHTGTVSFAVGPLMVFMAQPSVTAVSLGLRF
jgi:hypothetical protein